MARPGVTYLEVADAASNLQNKGENPTIDSVRRALGTGSNTTISIHLKKWRSENQPEVALLDKTTLPNDIIVTLQSLWDTLLAKANQTNEQLKIEHAQQVDDYQQSSRNKLKNSKRFIALTRSSPAKIKHCKTRLQKHPNLMRRTNKNNNRCPFDFKNNNRD